ncbi:MAG: hypothetical protein CEE40_01670 [Chloroflexi bacterium B3_Chlor]|nr:MAG: hypothetical protein CEE40_01670 [Chloroflexi bacterium B3_Chlor]
MNQPFLGYYLYRVLGSLAPLVPRRLGYWLAGQLGLVAFLLNPRGAAALKENLSHVLGEEADETAIQATAREVFRNLSKNYYDLFHRHALSDQESGASVTIRGQHHVKEALKEGQGLILASGHFGPFDASWQIGRILNVTITAPAEHLKPEKLYEYVCRLRANDWIRLLPIDGPLLGLVRALRKGEVVAVAADRDITRSGTLVDFFDAPARLPDGHVQLALRTGAKLVTCFAVRQPDNSCLIQVEPPLNLEITGDLKRDVQANVPKVVARLEEWIGRHPDQWLMLQPLWRDAKHGD